MTTSPNMGLPISTIGVDTGLNWEINLNAALTVLDAHNHTSGDGVQIPPAGLNINTALTFQGNAATNLGGVYFAALGSLLPTSDYSVLYADSAGDLYYNDGSGTQIQITANGALNVTASGIKSGTASASFSGGVLVVLSDTLTPASIKAGSYLMGQTGVSGSNYLTLSPPSSLSGSSYGLTLPSAVSGATQFMTLDSSGNMGTASGISPSQIQTNPSFSGNLSTTGTLTGFTSLTIHGASNDITLTNPAADVALIAGGVNQLQIWSSSAPTIGPSSGNTATFMGIFNSVSTNFGAMITGPTNSINALRVIRGTLAVTINSSGQITGVTGQGDGYTPTVTNVNGGITVTYGTAFASGSTPSITWSNSGGAITAAIIYDFNLASTRFSTATTAVEFVFGISAGTASTLNIDFEVVGPTTA